MLFRSDIGARLSSTIGYERKFNNFLQFTDAKSFTDFAIKTAPPVPRYYPLMKKVNAEGPKVLGSLPRVPGLSPRAFKDAIDKKIGVLVDVRNMQNVHRYFLYVALLFILILAYDVWKALWFFDPTTGKTSFGIGVGTIVLAMNVYLLSGYTFGCHSLRHLIGGFRDQIAKSPACYRAYACVSCLNRRHMRPSIVDGLNASIRSCMYSSSRLLWRR